MVLKQWFGCHWSYSDSPNGMQENLIWIRIVGDVVGTLRTCINMIMVVIVCSRSIVNKFIFFFSPVQT